MNLYTYESNCYRNGTTPGDLYGYHITSKSNLHSILVNGLVPDIGNNSNGVNEHHLNIYFTTQDQVDWWINRFNFDRNDIVILKFLCNDWRVRPGLHNDCFIRHSINSDDISVVDSTEVSLADYFNQNEAKLLLEENKKIVTQLKLVLERLDDVSSKEFVVEEIPWDYTEIDPDLMGTINVLKKVRSLDNKDDYIQTLEDIRERTLDRLINNSLGITPETEIFKTINLLFDDSLSDKPQISLFEMNSVAILVGANMFERLIKRFNDIGKSYRGLDQFNFSNFSFDGLSDGRFKDLYNETETMNMDRVNHFKR